MAGTPDRLDEVWQATIVDAAMPVGAIAVFVVAAVTTPLDSSRVDRVVLCALVLIVGVVGLVAGRAAAVLPAVMAAFSFDFFHVEPIRVLHLRSLLAASAFLLLVALVAGTRSIRGREDARARR